MKVKLRGISIASISTCIPKNEVNLVDLASDFGKSEVNKIIKTTGIKSIRKAEKNTTTSDLCAFAAKKMMDETGTTPDQIDAILFVSQTPDYKLPQTSHILQSKLGLKEDTICFDLGHPVEKNNPEKSSTMEEIILLYSQSNNKVNLISELTFNYVNKNHEIKQVVDKLLFFTKKTNGRVKTMLKYTLINSSILKISLKLFGKDLMKFKSNIADNEK